MTTLALIARWILTASTMEMLVTKDQARGWSEKKDECKGKNNIMGTAANTSSNTPTLASLNKDHIALADAVHGMLGRVLMLESRVHELEQKTNQQSMDVHRDGAEIQ